MYVSETKFFTRLSNAWSSILMTRPASLVLKARDPTFCVSFPWMRENPSPLYIFIALMNVALCQLMIKVVVSSRLSSNPCVRSTFWKFPTRIFRWFQPNNSTGWWWSERLLTSVRDSRIWPHLQLLWINLVQVHSERNWKVYSPEGCSRLLCCLAQQNIFFWWSWLKGDEEWFFTVGRSCECVCSSEILRQGNVHRCNFYVKEKKKSKKQRIFLFLSGLSNCKYKVDLLIIILV